MYDLRQFKPALYALVIIGITGFAIAAESIEVWVLGVGSTMLNYWWVKSGGFKPLPRKIANGGTLLSVMILIWILRAGVATAPILLIGYFLVFLQIVKLYEQRANRDYAQLLVLGPLLMVAGAISTYSLIFGLLFISYLILWLYCCLLFHLKVETDLASRTMGLPATAPLAAVVQQHQREIGRAMRRFTVLIALFAVSSAVLTFVLFPRVVGSGMFSPFEFKPSQTLTGFSDSVSFQNVAMITQSQEQVASVKVMRNTGQPFASLLVLRGTTLDRYTGRAEGSGNAPYQWVRSVQPLQPQGIEAGHTRRYDNQPLEGNELRQQIKLDPTGTNVLFAMGGIVSFTPKSSGMFRFWRHDQVLQTAEALVAPIEYEVISRDRLTADRMPGPLHSEAEREYINAIDPKIGEFARRVEVSGSDAEGPLAPRRPIAANISPLDTQIAQNMETYLRNNFTYTLDLTDAQRIAGQDPLVAFLYDLKRGHCEYFAGAMTLMCQSLGMQARMVVGFRCDEYNAIGNYYTVRQSHAHAWVEVLGDDGIWHTFDPTSSREDTMARNYTLWQRIQSLFSYMEYTWANTVVAYDPARQEDLIQNVDLHLVRTADNSGRAINQTIEWIGDKVFGTPVFWVIVFLLGLAGSIPIIRDVWKRWQLLGRMRVFHLNQLPPKRRVIVARQLEFYDRLLRLLERHRIHYPAHLTPLEFSQSLTFLPTEAFNALRGVTEAFYRVRYGQMDLTAEEQAALLDSVAQIAPILSAHS